MTDALADALAAGRLTAAQEREADEIIAAACREIRRRHRAVDPRGAAPQGGQWYASYYVRGLLGLERLP